MVLFIPFSCIQTTVPKPRKTQEVTQNLIKSSLLFTLGTLCSRVSGLAREAVLSYSFGASPRFDAFVIALRLPNLLRDMLAEGALSQAFTKVYSQLQLESRERGHELLLATTKFFFLTSLIISIAGVFFAPELVDLFTLLAEGERKAALLADATLLTRLVFPWILLAVMSAVFMGALHQEGKFFHSACAPLLLNLGFIGGALGLARLFPQLDFLPVPMHLRELCGLAVGVLLGGLMHCYFLLRSLSVAVLSVLRTHGKILPFSPDLRKVITLMLPMAVASSAAPINVFINTNFATALEAGAVSWLYYAFRLVHLPIALFGVAVGIALLPALTEAVTRGKGFDTHASQLLQQAVELVLWLLSICFVFVLVNHFYITQLIYQQGSFTRTDTDNSSAALLMYSMGLIGYGLMKVLISVYYAVDRTAFVMKISFALIALNLVLNALLVQVLGFRGLALTTAIVVTANAVVLAFGLRREKISWSWATLRRSLFFLLLLLVIGGGAQQLLLLYWENMPLLTGKLKALVIVLSNGVLLSVLAALSGFLYLRKNPLHLLRSRS